MAKTRREALIKVRGQKMGKKIGKAHVWYACYGSNLLKKRFLCYIRGGTLHGSAKSNPGCRDKTLPKDDKPIKIPFPLYFAKKSSRWNGMGVAFISLKRDEKEVTLGRMYLISEEQFIDVVKQENKTDHILINFQKAKEQGFMEVLENWYGTIVYLGDEDGFPIFTFTQKADIGSEPFNPPCIEYLKTLIQGLKEAYKLTNESIAAYLVSKPGIKQGYTKEDVTRIAEETAEAEGKGR